MITLSDKAFCVGTVEEWFKTWPPEGGESQWVNGQSAKEMAKAWFPRDGSATVPAGLQRILASHEKTRDLHIETAAAEATIELDNYRGKHRQADLVLQGTSGHTKVTVHVEAKANEAFGSGTVGEEWERAVSSGPSSKVPERISNICGLLFRTPPFPREVNAVPPEIAALRYQLVYATAATILDAQRRASDIAVFLVHELLPSDRDFIFRDEKGEPRHSINTEVSWRRVDQNERDFSAFVDALRKFSPSVGGNDGLVEVRGIVPPIDREWTAGERETLLLIGKAADATDGPADPS